MSSHPNVVLLLRLTPDGLSRKTLRDILFGDPTNSPDDESINIGGTDYSYLILEDSYDDDWQVSGKEGDLLFFDLVTYGYGKSISWDELATKKESLESWAQSICQSHSCDYEIVVTANHW